MALSLTELETEQLIEALENGGDSARFHDLLRRANLLDFPAAWANLVRLFESFLGEQFAALLPQVLGELSRAADPDRALRNLARFIGQSFNPFGFGRRLRGSEDLLRFLVQTFGFSQFLSDILIRNPEYLDWLRTPGVLERPKLLAHYELELEQASEIFIDP